MSETNMSGTDPSSGIMLGTVNGMRCMDEIQRALYKSAKGCLVSTMLDSDRAQRAAYSFKCETSPGNWKKRPAPVVPSSEPEPALLLGPFSQRKVLHKIQFVTQFAFYKDNED